MTPHVRTRAPGKLFLLGEYAVLDGCPAVVAAIDRYVEVRLQLTGPQRSVVIEAPQLEAVVTFAPADPPVHHPLRFALAAYRGALARLPEIAGQGMQIQVASQLTTAVDASSGLGSSAAVVVATAAALYAAADRDLTDPSIRADLLSTGLEAHRLAQGGSGSGGDVAASVYGGIVRFESYSGRPVDVQPLHYPQSLILLAGWTGEPASTPNLIAAYRAAVQHAPALRAGFIDASRAAVTHFLDALAQGAGCADALNENGSALERFDDELSLGVMTPRLRELVRIARTAGAGAKPSGAGGGDCGIALTQSPGAAEHIRAAWTHAGITPLHLRIDQQGVTNVRC